MQNTAANVSIWRSFCLALGTEYRDYTEIKGQSGLTHSVQAIGVDDKTQRVVIVSAEHSPRIAALMQVDIQATMPRAKVLVARPIAVDLAHTARKLFTTQNGNLDLAKLGELSTLLTKGDKGGKALTKRYSALLTPLLSSIQRSGLPVQSHIQNAFEQIMSLDWPKIADRSGVLGEQLAFNFIDLLRTVDNLSGDRAQGVCPVPTYELSDSDWELFQSGAHIDEVQERLKAMQIYQYFYPPSDSLTLGLIENGISTGPEIASGWKLAGDAGHQLDKNELVPENGLLPDLLEELRSHGYVAEGEFSWELTEAGKTVRHQLKVRPNESLLTKLINRFSVNISISLKDLFPPSPPLT